RRIERGEILVEGLEVAVRDVDEGLRGREPERELRQYTERAERAVHHLEHERVFVVRSTHEHVARGRDDLVLETRIVKTTVAKRHRLDRAARHRASDRDGGELRNHEWHEAVAQGRGDEVDERHSGLGDADLTFGIDRKNLVELGQVELRIRRNQVSALG